VLLHFAEIWADQASQRTFHVNVNGTRVLTEYDIFAEATGKNIAIVEEHQTTANASGMVVIEFLKGSNNNPKISGIEIVTAESGENEGL